MERRVWIEYTLVSIPRNENGNPLPSPGPLGLLERLFNSGVMRRIYNEELRLLAEYVTGGNGGRAA
jgi:hypothetical protein